jgi:hypothetical protein
MQTHTNPKFDEKRQLWLFRGSEVRTAFEFLASVPKLSEVGARFETSEVYTAFGLYAEKHGPVGIDCLDAAMRFLVRFGFLVTSSKVQWLVRKPFTAADVSEAVTVGMMNITPKYEQENAFDGLRRVRLEKLRSMTSSQ